MPSIKALAKQSAAQKAPPDLNAIMRVFDVIEAEAQEYEHRAGNQLRAVYLRERLLPKMWAAFGADVGGLVAGGAANPPLIPPSLPPR